MPRTYLGPMIAVSSRVCNRPKAFERVVHFSCPRLVTYVQVTSVHSKTVLLGKNSTSQVSSLLSVSVSVSLNLSSVLFVDCRQRNVELKRTHKLKARHVPERNTESTIEPSSFLTMMISLLFCFSFCVLLFVKDVWWCSVRGFVGFVCGLLRFLSKILLTLRSASA